MANAVRQNETPMPYANTLRSDNQSIRTSSPAGVVAPIACIPLHRKDSASGRIAVECELAEMPKPLENLVIGRFQAWFVPRPALPQFGGLDDYTHAFQGKTQTALGVADRAPRALFDTVSAGSIAAAESSEFYRSLGISLVAGVEINTDYVDAYNLVHNFRLAAHSSKAPRELYYSEANVASQRLKPAFWPRNRMHNVVPDYEQALVKGSLDLDVTAGLVPISGLGKPSGTTAPEFTVATTGVQESDGSSVTYSNWSFVGDDSSPRHLYLEQDANGKPLIFADMEGHTIPTTLADIDKARTTQAFAKAMASMAGNNFSGFNNDDVIVAELMQGFDVPEELFNRPWLLDSKTVVFGMQERHATDAANLDASVTVGSAEATLSINVPKANYGGVIIVTCEVMPERLYERQSDEYLYCTSVDDLPNALRDLQRTEPVDVVLNRRVDTAHATPAGTFGYEPMNAKWKREFTRLGGEFRQLTPGTPSTLARTALWQVDYVDPAFTTDHYLCEHPFPQDVFSVPANDCVNIAALQQITIAGHTQFGDELVEDNGEFDAVEAAQV